MGNTFDLFIKQDILNAFNEKYKELGAIILSFVYYLRSGWVRFYWVLGSPVVLGPPKGVRHCEKVPRLISFWGVNSAYPALCVIAQRNVLS